MNKVGDSMTDLELRHYGVKGMKWGVRKNRSDIPTDKESKNLEKTIEKTRNKTRDKIRKKIDKRSRLAALIASGQNFVQQNIIQQQLDTQRFMQWSAMESTRAAINASNQAASLTMSGGTNPFMFGMM